MLNKRQAELEVRERNVFKERAKVAEDKIAQVDALLKKAEGRSPRQVCRGRQHSVLTSSMKKAEAEAAAEGEG
jgi:hypothetical protein